VIFSDIIRKDISKENLAEFGVGLLVHCVGDAVWKVRRHYHVDYAHHRLVSGRLSG